MEAVERHDPLKPKNIIIPNLGTSLSFVNVNLVQGDKVTSGGHPIRIEFINQLEFSTTLARMSIIPRQGFTLFP